MKKLMMVLAAAACVSAASAADFKWGAISGALYTPTGTAEQKSTTKITSNATAYLFDAGTLSRAALLEGLLDGTYASVEAAFAAKGVAAAPALSVNGSSQFATTTTAFDFGEGGKTYSFYAAIISSDYTDFVGISKEISVQASSTPGDFKTIAIPTLNPTQVAPITDGKIITNSSWYQTVPEPTSGLLLLLGVAGLALRRRRA